MTKFGIPTMLKLALAMLAVAASAAGQKLPTATAPGASITVGGTYSAFEAKYPQGVQGGAGIYVDLNFRHYVGLEGEIHYLRQNTIAGSNQTTYVIGPRVELHYGRFSPYAKAFIGNGKLTFPYNLGYGNYVIAGGGGGIDYQLTENLKLRAIDFEYQYWPNFTLGSISPYGVSAGLSYRILHTGGWHHHHYR
ncbi:opacity protein-like surface antigen [Granulicella aggregans]|uniref:Opacity protein-like surface antigen n=1 Tax=Granulicella aggregans TaxID=474949 RepID=A0A7W7Z9I5_9BACT|nr:outer membrane beta-barrel protein [Granulicella aggregans]MBB5055740.1 opacity protein-like surface antigen [Granulicella aggregans]